MNSCIECISILFLLSCPYLYLYSPFPHVYSLPPRLKLGYLVQSVAFHPRDPNILAVGSESDLYLINLELHRSWASRTEETLNFSPEGGVQPNMKLSKTLLSTTTGDLNEDSDDEEVKAKKSEEAAAAKAARRAKRKEETGEDEESDSECRREKDESNMRRTLMKEIVWRSVRPTKEARRAYKKTGNAELEDVEGVTRSTALHKKGVRIAIEHDGLIKELQWHKKGNYLSCVSLNCSSKANTVVIHNLTSKKSMKPFGGKLLQTGSGVSVVSAAFHPRKAQFFIATTRTVRVFDLQAARKIKQLITGNKWISSLSVHPNGEHLIVGTLDRRMLWFDLELGTKPWKTLKNYHNRGIRSVGFFQQVSPHVEEWNCDKEKEEKAAMKADIAAREMDAEKAAKKAKQEADEEDNRSDSEADKDMENPREQHSVAADGRKLLTKKGVHFPLMCTTSDDGSIHIFHAKVTNDYVTPPMLVPVKKLRSPHMFLEDKVAKKELRKLSEGGKAIVKSREKTAVAVLTATWHPTHPWLFSAGADGKAYLWV